MIGWVKRILRPPKLHQHALTMDWPYLWYENEFGERVVPEPQKADPSEQPPGFKYQHSTFPCELQHRIHDCEAKQPLATGSTNYWQQIVEAMVRAGHPLDKSVLVVAEACERCMNVLAWEYRVGGYPYESEAYNKAGTSCRICENGGPV